MRLACGPQTRYWRRGLPHDRHPVLVIFRSTEDQPLGAQGTSVCDDLGLCLQSKVQTLRWAGPCALPYVL